MSKCKIGIRNNLYYPLMLIVCISIRKIDEIIINLSCQYDKGYFIIPLLIYTSQFLAGLIPFFNSEKKKTSEKNNAYSGIELIKNQSTIDQPDNETKIYILIIFASFFNYIGVIVRKNINDIFHFENKVRGIQIIFSALLCYFTIRIKIYKHQLISLIVIFIALIIILLFDILENKAKEINLYKYYGFGIFSCLSRTFLDTIEKYLFEFDYLNPYKVLMLEGLIGCLLLPILFITNKTNEDFNYFSGKEAWKLALLVILLIIYLVLSLFKNIYRVLTIKLYSPMTRALAESIIDPFDFIYLFIGEEIKEITNFIVILISLFITSFLSFVYNDFIVLYCCGLEYNTHLEILKRSLLYENINGSIMDLENDIIDKEENNNGNAELTIK